MGIYDTTRQYYLGQLHEQHRGLAANLAQDYHGQVAAFDAYWRSLSAYGGTPSAANRATYEAARHAYYEQYVERFYQLQADIEQQTAAINADYDTRDREYEAAFAALGTSADVPSYDDPDWEEYSESRPSFVESWLGWLR